MNIKDIAKISGVGVSTVSRVLNEHPDVNVETRKKVLKVMDEYGYIPNNSARNLKRSVSKNIGVLVKGVYNPFFAKIIQIIGEEIHKEGYSMMLHYNHSDSSDFEVAAELVKEKKLRGLISLGGEFQDLSEEQLLGMKVPIILTSTKINGKVNRKLFSTVTIKNQDAAFEAVDYLCKLGHKKIGIITTGSRDISIGQMRLEGYKEALTANNIQVNNDLIEIGKYTFESGYEAMTKLLNNDLGVTAIFVTSDIMAIGAAKAITNKGLQIPKDISLVGFDGIDFAEYFNPSLTTVKQPDEYMGQKSVEILFDLIKKKNNHQHVVLDTKLLIRESCKNLIDTLED
ncbi:LacI family DNA-binding transcriptional regulator [Alkaliphilus peptidifermentans]|uniref:Transcriptional regulator, LacI family n=1 Tax=Alkaliphilus peptidifermentans DSM 18978 TaxID=1120976 RepID=A0A1G5J3R3_9FIRM|nr:LacI family DNA-binding transcriptional regulator [Alkaliphilus peptidifermentans]SCY82580.1 transcriptional regulator, LacI family [Alkaliphilus peptidifermentans DSM 18978]